MQNGLSNDQDGDTAGNVNRNEGVDKTLPITPELLQNALNNCVEDIRPTTSENCSQAAIEAITDIDSNAKGRVTSGNNESIVEGAAGIAASSSTVPESPSTNRCELLTPRTSAPASMWSVGSLVCRICHTGEQPDRLISPCICKGTLAYVHKNCLEHWLSTSGMLSCELCHYRFQTQQSLRYSFLQSIRLWYKHPNNRGLLQADFLVCSLLTVVSFGLIGICMLGLQYFVIQGKRLGISKLWTQGSIIVFLIIVAFVYCVNLFLILKSQLVPWYRWWQSARQIKLILIDRRPLYRRKKTKATTANVDEIEIRSTILNVHSNGNENSTVIPIPVVAE